MFDEQVTPLPPNPYDWTGDRSTHLNCISSRSPTGRDLRSASTARSNVWFGEPVIPGFVIITRAYQTRRCVLAPAVRHDRNEVHHIMSAADTSDSSKLTPKC